MLRRELKARDEDVRQLELETQVCDVILRHVLNMYRTLD